MKTATYLIAALLAGAAVLMPACSKDAGEMEREGEKEQVMTHGEHDTMMAKQHESMIATQREWLKVKEAIEQGKSEEAREPARQIGEQAGHLEEFMLHKNPEKRDEFLARAKEYKSLVMTLEQHLEYGDSKSLKDIAPEIDRSCNGCHQSFR